VLLVILLLGPVLANLIASQASMVLDEFPMASR
jgi:hypothetical protein